MLAVWARAAAVLALLTLLARDRALLLWAGALLAAWALGGLLLGAVLDRLAVSQAVSSAEAFAGETITVHLRLTNRSMLPLPWVRLDQTLPRRLERRTPRWLASLPPGETFQAAYALRLGRRGVYRLGRVGVEVGDWFGLWRRQGRVELPLWVTVFPRPLEQVPLPPPPRLPEGDRARPGSPFRAWEPSGLREYRRGDPPRWIAWKATARRGELVVREFPPVRDRAHVIVLDLRPGRWPAARRDAWQERALSLAAAWIARSAERDEPVGLLAFGRARRYEPDPEGEPPPGAVTLAPAAGPVALRALGAGPLAEGAVRVELPTRRGPEHRRQLLRVLAALEPAEDPGFTQGALAGLRRLAVRGSVLWVAGAADAETLGAAAAAARAGHAVSLVVAGGGPAATAPGVSVWTLPPGEGPEWG